MCLFVCLGYWNGIVIKSGSEQENLHCFLHFNSSPARCHHFFFFFFYFLPIFNFFFLENFNFNPTCMMHPSKSIRINNVFFSKKKKIRVNNVAVIGGKVLNFGPV